MADKIDVNVTDNSPKAKKEMEQAIEKILTALGEHAEACAKDEITGQGAIDTGLLRNSITWAIGGESANISNYKADRGGKTGTYSGQAEKLENPCVYVGTNVEYAEYVETGTSRMPARPFIRPAVEKHKNDYITIIKDGLKEK